MTQTLRCSRALALAALAVSVAACRKQAAATPAQLAAPPPQKTAAVGGPSASVAKPLDGSTEARRPGPHPPAQPCIDLPAGREAALPDLLEQAGRDFEK